jgi:hypothetical protein
LFDSVGGGCVDSMWQVTQLSSIAAWFPFVPTFAK